jgi:MFS family permease
MFFRLSVTVISPDLARDLNLNAVQLGSLSAAFFYAFAVTQVPLGLALDSIGARSVMTVLSVVGILGAVLFALAQTAGQAVWGRILLGIGMSGNLMGLLVLMAAWFPAERFATLLGLFVGIGSVGACWPPPLWHCWPGGSAGGGVSWPLPCSIPYTPWFSSWWCATIQRGQPVSSHLPPIPFKDYGGCFNSLPTGGSAWGPFSATAA